jgi:hypothetical protein
MRQGGHAEGGFGACGQRVARRAGGHRQLILALHQRREARHLLAGGDQPCRIVAGVAADVVRRDVDMALADRHRAQQVAGQAPEVRQPLRRRRVFDRPADQRRGRAGMLVPGVPRAARQHAGLEAAAVRAAVGPGSRGVHRRFSGGGGWRARSSPVARCAAGLPRYRGQSARFNQASVSRTQ